MTPKVLDKLTDQSKVDFEAALQAYIDSEKFTMPAENKSAFLSQKEKESQGFHTALVELGAKLLVTRALNGESPTAVLGWLRNYPGNPKLETFRDTILPIIERDMWEIALAIALNKPATFAFPTIANIDTQDIHRMLVSSASNVLE